jgi:hypothetical protein
MASIIKADNIQKVSDGTNIIKKCGSTITLGSCGATISLAAGATQTGFGRTGTVDWCTTAKDSSFYWSVRQWDILLILLVVQ